MTNAVWKNETEEMHCGKIEIFSNSQSKLQWNEFMSNPIKILKCKCDIPKKYISDVLNSLLNYHNLDW